jgi:hypothetical protein
MATILASSAQRRKWLASAPPPNILNDGIMACAYGAESQIKTAAGVT